MISQQEIESFVDKHIDEWAKDTILAETIRYAQAANLPQSFIDHLGLVRATDATSDRSSVKVMLKNGKKIQRILMNFKYRLTNDWMYDDERYGRKYMARYFEFGTRQHWIAPREASVLIWNSAGPESGHGHAIYSKRHDNPKGQLLFSKGHYITGIPKSMAMANGVTHGRRRLSHKIQWEIKQFLRSRTNGRR